MYTTPAKVIAARTIPEIAERTSFLFIDLGNLIVRPVCSTMVLLRIMLNVFVFFLSPKKQISENYSELVHRRHYY